MLHSVPWKKGASFQNIISDYAHRVNMLSNSFASCTVIFDGYLVSSTKDHTHFSRYPVASLEVEITPNTIFDSKKEILLSNPKNKQRFVRLLAENLTRSGITCMICEDDADMEIVNAAMTISLEKAVCVLADDTDITVLLIL